jgi:hypothetical protein
MKYTKSSIRSNPSQSSFIDKLMVDRRTVEFGEPGSICEWLFSKRGGLPSAPSAPPLPSGVIRASPPVTPAMRHVPDPPTPPLMTPPAPSVPARAPHEGHIASQNMQNRYEELHATVQRSRDWIDVVDYSWQDGVSKDHAPPLITLPSPPPHTMVLSVAPKTQPCARKRICTSLDFWGFVQLRERRAAHHRHPTAHELLWATYTCVYTLGAPVRLYAAALGGEDKLIAGIYSQKEALVKEAFTARALLREEGVLPEAPLTRVAGRSGGRGKTMPLVVEQLRWRYPGWF